ncbi:four helix bundle protein [Nostoc sp. FACHB-87]|uniref:four helix bundle protein n=1 Tax=Nostocaceae TaxID=1162 RepID=UPI001686562B|nr:MULTISPECIES: four helix bundle protein [Nostocaceae]MBD2297976.1 four helix bundle protein [Nostoc sp. FACHB-190]MBD2454134.1 four helix bundle protein [Nostoc sp. FACHB-87]MBD2476171.1 four helix bundle protein [Anabaena sp. FACHB-83]
MQSYRDLKVWQEAMNVAELCYKATKAFPKEETYGMIAQIRRDASSIPANIAEGYGRRTCGEYIQFLYIAQGSLKELETHLLLSIRVELASSQIIIPVVNQCESVGKLLFFLIRSLEK